MKKTIILFLAISTIHTSFAESKNELIERFLVITDAKAQFDDVYQKIWEPHKADFNSDELAIIKKHFTWESFKAFRTKILLEHYSEDDLRTLIELHESINPEWKQLHEKMTEVQIATQRENKHYTEVVLKKISEDFQKLAPDPAPSHKSYAERWDSWDRPQRWFFIDGYKAGCERTIIDFSNELDAEKSVCEKVTKLTKLETETIKLSRAVTEFYFEPDNADTPFIPTFHLVDAQIQSSTSETNNPNQLSEVVRQP